MLLRGEVLRQFDKLSAEVRSACPENLTLFYFRFGYIVFPINALSKEKRLMCRRMRNPSGLKVRRHAARKLDLNEYLDLFPGSKISDKICVMELN